MIKNCKKIAFFNVRETWFDYQYNFWDIFSLNVFMHIRNKGSKIIPGVKEISYTVELDLVQVTESILSNFSSEIRIQSRKAEKAGISCFFQDDIDGFVDFYNDFALKKGTYTTSKEYLKALNGNLKMSFAKNNEEILVAHSYLVDKDLGIVRGINSGTKRLNENYDSKLISKAHKYLILKDILYFKEMGFKTFDFGGYAKDTNNESLKGINKFKLMFGGKVVSCLNYYSYSYWVLKKLTKILGLSGKL